MTHDVEADVSARLKEQVDLVHSADEQGEAVRAWLTEPLTAERAVAIALRQNRELRATLEEIGIARGELLHAAVLPNPTAAGHIRFPVGTTNRSTIPNSTDYEGDLSIDLTRLILSGMRKGAAESRVEQAKIAAATHASQLAADVRAAFYAFQGESQLLGMHELAARAAEAAAEMGERQFEAGNLSELDLVHERMALQEARVEISRGELKLAHAREALNRLMGLGSSELGWSADGRLPELPHGEVDLSDLETLATSRSLLVLAAKQELESSHHAVQLASWSRVPSVRAGISGGQEVDTPTVIGPVFEIELPLFNQNQGEVARAEAELRRSKERLRAAEDRVRSEVRAARLRLLTARDLVEYYRKSVIPLRQRAVELAQKHYNSMTLGVYDLLRTKRLEVDALREGNDALREYWQSRVELERVVGASLAADRPAPPPGKLSSGAGLPPMPETVPEAAPKAHQHHMHPKEK